jgi:hypothetical protein
MTSSKIYYAWVGAAIGAALLLVGCATQLVNSNVLDAASTTVDDLTVRQIVFNLARIKENQFALPSQVQITSGSISAGLSVSPSISPPLSASISTSINRAAGVTTSTSRNVDVPSVGASFGGSASTTDGWSINLIQDPEQLRRLRLLYQYGAHQISATDLLCQYPIPELLQDQSPRQRRYVRFTGDIINGCRPPDVVLVDNPDPAFLGFPGCIICAFPDKNFSDLFAQKVRGHKIYKSDFSPETEDYDKDFEYVQVALNNRLFPNSALPRARAATLGMIDWLSVVREGVDPIPNNSRRIGSSNGYAVYVHPVLVQPAYGYPGYGREGPFTGDEHFAEFVLSIIEATLQPRQLDKIGPIAPPLTQSLPTSSH